jgi:hypothetical protein
MLQVLGKILLNQTTKAEFIKDHLQTMLLNIAPQILTLDKN